MPGHEGAVRVSQPAEQHNEGNHGWASCKPPKAAAMMATPEARRDTTATSTARPYTAPAFVLLPASLPPHRLQSQLHAITTMPVPMQATTETHNSLPMHKLQPPQRQATTVTTLATHDGSKATMTVTPATITAVAAA